MLGQMFQSTLFSVILISLFLRFTFFVIVKYNTTLNYENVNKSTPYLFRVICVSAGFGHCLVRLCSLKTKYKLYALRIDQGKYSR